MDDKNISQSELIISFYRARPNVKIKHSEAVDWATEEYLKRTGKIFRDPDRAVRKASQEGVLIKVSKGVYMYDPNHVRRNDLYDFTPQQKIEILERDGYRCVVCGRGRAEGVDLQIDHIKPKDQGGRNTIENGQTLCGQHNFIKKNYSQTEAGKRFFLKLRKQAKALGDKHMLAFTDAILKVYKKFGYDKQIDDKD